MTATAPAVRPAAPTTLGGTVRDLDARLYAASLMNRADVILSAERIAVVAKVIAVVEADVVAMLRRHVEDRSLASIVAADWRTVLTALGEDIEDGKHRPTPKVPA